MCGICGIVDFKNKIPKHIVKKMVSTIAYRGPDNEGFHFSENVGLGHKRLSIVDTSEAGNQPLYSKDKSIVLVFNGEIYNYKSLKNELESKGHKFSSNTDAEVLIHLYEEQGVSLLSCLEGMFAFAIWDNKEQRVFLARDRLGIKPLYYCCYENKIVFGSEIKSIFASNHIAKIINKEALKEYLSYNYISAPATIYENVYKVQPAQYISFNKERGWSQTYWDIPSYLSTDSFEESKEKLFGLLNESVCNRMVADRPIGCFLSGGLDSSIVAGLMSKNSFPSIDTFSIGFKDKLYNETNYSREVSCFHRTNHHEFILTQKDIIDIVPEVLSNLDEPFADSSILPFYLLSKYAVKHAPVMLSGDGADELFGGYRIHRGEYLAKYYNKVPSFVRILIDKVLKRLPEDRSDLYLEKLRRISKFTKGFDKDLLIRYNNWRKNSEAIDCLLGSKYFSQDRKVCQGDNITKTLYLDVKGLLPNDMLTKVDRASMYNSLEVRVPFLNHKLVEFAFTLPSRFKINKNHQKYILKETFKDILPDTIINRPKSGFEVPISDWLRKDLRFLLGEYLSEAKVKSQGLFNYSVMKQMVDQHMSKKKDYSWSLWNLITFQCWYYNNNF